MRILEVIHDFLISCRAGSEYHCYYLSRELSRNHEVKLFFTIPDDGSQEKLNEGQYDGISYWALKKNYPSFYHHPFQERDRRVDTYFSALIDDFKPDLIHFQHLINLSWNLPTLAKKKGIPTFFTLHDYWLLCPKITFLDSDHSICDDNAPRKCVQCLCQETSSATAHYAAKYAKKAAAFCSLLLWRSQWVKRVLRDIELFIAPSRFLQEKYVQHGLSREKVVLVRHGLDINLFRGIKRTPSSTIRFGFFGSISAHKGIYLLIDAFNMISGSADLKIFGKVPEHILPELSRKIKNPRIRIMGEMTGSDKTKAFSELDVMIVPSLCYENSPLTISEALLAKMPVICSDIGGMSELVENGKNGFTFPVGDCGKLAEKIDLFIKNPDLVCQFASNISAVNDIRTNAEEILRLYTNLAALPRRRELNFNIIAQ
jgi:glycosyltransferase involved in cell wall biosynthesis